MRGLGAKIKRSVLRKLLVSHDPWFTFIQESKLDSLSQRTIQSIWNLSDVECLWSPSIGASGGLISIWRSSQFLLNFSHTDRNWIAMGGRLKSNGFECLIINIYNSCDAGVRENTWEEIEDFCKSSPLPCLITGDFNETLEAKDRGSQQFYPSSAAKFKNFVHNLLLIEVNPSEGWFTWFRGKSKSKLDRVFVQVEWLTIFPALNVSILKRSISDHCPLLINSHEIDWGPKPFRFQDAWLSHKGCMEIISTAWNKSSNLPIMEKLKFVKTDLKTWNH